MEQNHCSHLGFPIDTILSGFDPGHPVATEQVSAQGDQRFGERCWKLIFKMAAVAAILDFLMAQLANLCLLSTLMLIIKFPFNYRNVQNMDSEIFAHINV